MAFPKLSPTKYDGLKYYNDNIKGKVFIAVFIVAAKKYRKVVGYSNDEYRTTDKIAFIKKEELKEIASKGNYVNKELTLENIWDMYLDHIKSSKSNSEKTIAAKEGHWKNHIKKSLAKKSINKIRNHDVQTIINNSLKINSPKTAKNIGNTISSIFNYALKNEYAKDNPARYLDIPKFDNVRTYPLTNDESKRLFNTIINYDEMIYRGIFTFLVHGRRLNEVLSMEWGMLNIDKKLYTVGYDINKAKRNMIYEITSELLEVFINSEHRSGLIFRSPVTGEKFKDIRRAWNRILSAAGIEANVTIHDLRHLIGEISVNELDLPLETVAAILGHTNTNITGRYSKVRTDTAAKGLNKVFEYLKA
ncbi:MAG: hypothetical protein DRG78_05755 [Epsilonproteobacteria bacterium]|nr:MAG: hypothetical protein DRG78_05755 [Campylobacterota bacterium]